MRLKNKIALITGAAQGLGAAIARRFSQEGASVVICDLNAEAGAITVAAIEAAGGIAVFQHLDVSNEQDWIQAMAAVDA